MSLQQSQFEASRVYHDFNSLNQLKAKGKDDNPDAIREAAKQFESVFVGMMLKSMREANAAIVDEPLFDSAQMDMYQDMHDEQLSLHLGSSESGFGLTDILVQQLTGNIGNVSEAKQSEAAQFNPTRVTRARAAQPLMAAAPSKLQQKAADAVAIAAVENNEQVVEVKGMTDSTEERGLDFSSPTAFVQSLWPYAQQAAKSLQLDPKLLLAQAALETGWGKFVMRNQQGSSSKNLFGIKANHDWQGEKACVNTLEVESGAVIRKKAEFRSYDSYAESFADYAKFISEGPRYQRAMTEASTPEKYLQELQSAGYATDPDYASKIGSIYNSPTLNDAVRSIASMP